MVHKIVIGNPKENKFNCGAERVIMPTTRLISSRYPTIGIIMRTAVSNIFSEELKIAK